MTKREKILALGVAIVVVALLAQFGINRVRSGFKIKMNRLIALSDEVSKKQKIVADGFVAKQKMEAIAAKSLPKNSERAVARYREWLDKIIKDAGLQSPQNLFVKSSTEKDLYDSHQFQISGKGTLPQIVQLMFQFYEKDYLHRIRSLKISPERGQPYQLALVMEMDALSLNSASPTQAEPKDKSNRVALELDEYRERIVSRNLFSPANRPPALQKTVAVQVAKDSSLDFQAAANDPDAGQKVLYEILGEAPKGLSIDKSTGKLVWLPRDLGDYQVTVKAKDDGIPSQSSVQTVAIKVIPPPPPIETKEPPKFDVASQSFVNAFLTGSKGQPEVWIRSQTEEKTFQLKIGDELKLGGVVGKVTAIGATYAEFETEGKRWIVGMDESLADAFRRMEID
jgi:Putative Ig domain